jgi:hypothetical protein
VIVNTVAAPITAARSLRSRGVITSGLTTAVVWRHGLRSAVKVV